MDSLLQFDVTHAYLVVFAAVLLDVIALPLVAMPVLLMAGGWQRQARYPYCLSSLSQLSHPRLAIPFGTPSVVTEVRN